MPNTEISNEVGVYTDSGNEISVSNTKVDLDPKNITNMKIETSLLHTFKTECLDNLSIESEVDEELITMLESCPKLNGIGYNKIVTYTWAANVEKILCPKNFNAKLLTELIMIALEEKALEWFKKKTIKIDDYQKKTCYFFTDMICQQYKHNDDSQSKIELFLTYQVSNLHELKVFTRIRADLCDFLDTYNDAILKSILRSKLPTLLRYELLNKPYLNFNESVAWLQTNFRSLEISTSISNGKQFKGK